MRWNGFLSLAATFLCLNAFADKTIKKYPVVEGEFIVKLKSSKIKLQSVQSLFSKTTILAAQPFATDPSLVKIKVDSKNKKGFMLEAKQNPNIEYAEPNYILKTNTVPDDTDFAQNWGLLNNGQKDPKGNVGTAGNDIDATLAWDLEKGSNDIVVAVIDTGVDYNHEELKENIFVNTKEIPGNGKDDDGNGFIDDVHGWNFEGKNNEPMDDNRHGTHCSGTIGAKGNNKIGTAGVTWNVRILPVKFLSAEGSGSLADAVESINYATLMKVNVMSNSWGGGGFSQTMLDAIKKAKDAGILFVAAAGNESNDNDSGPSYPASYDVDNVVSVAATDNNDIKASWSNWGQKSVHLAAPGVNIYSTLPTSMGKYGSLSGTSMATPHVAGAAALLWSHFRDMSYADIKARLLATVDPVRGLKRNTLSGGRLNINNALRNIVPPRNEPDPTQWKSVAVKFETAHPYLANSNVFVGEIKHPGAKFLRLRFESIDVEGGYDYAIFRDANGKQLDQYTGKADNYTTEYVEGDTVRIYLFSDSSVNANGFVIDQYEFID